MFKFFPKITVIDFPIYIYIYMVVSRLFNTKYAPLHPTENHKKKERVIKKAKCSDIMHRYRGATEKESTKNIEMPARQVSHK